MRLAGAPLYHQEQREQQEADLWGQQEADHPREGHQEADLQW